jgi:TonB family protein
MRLMRAFEKPVLLIAAVAVNLGLYLLVPYVQVLIRKHANVPKAPTIVERTLEFSPPTAERLAKREIKQIKLASLDPPQPNPSRPSTPGGGLKIDLSPAGGDGLSLLSGGDRTGGIGAGTGGGTGKGISAMTYQVGQTDTDAKPTISPPPKYPPRAEREGVTGHVDVYFLVNEMGLPEQLSILKEDPTGYGFGKAALENVKAMRFKPATLQKMAVRQWVRIPVEFNAD